MEDQVATLTDTVNVLEDESIALKNVKGKLEEELRQLKQNRNGRSNLVSIQAMKKHRGGKKKG
jgi:hypothetical protein